MGSEPHEQQRPEPGTLKAGPGTSPLRARWTPAPACVTRFRHDPLKVHVAAPFPVSMTRKLAGSGCLFSALMFVTGCTGQTTSSEPSPIAISPDDRYVVAVSPELDPGAIEESGGAVVLELPEASAVVVQIDPSLLAELAAIPGVEGVEPDARRYPLGQSVPYGIPMVQADQLALTAGRGGPVGVCVIDSGLARGHEDLPAATGAPNGGAGEWYEDGCGHGTHVAGTIAALDNELGVIGVAPRGVRIHAVRVFGNDCRWAYASTLTAALYRCMQAGARVVNMSLGGSSPNGIERRAFGLAERHGVLSVAAAGNAGNSSTSYPAGYDSVISVAAVAQNHIVASFSQRNPDVELSAPGVSVLSTVPSGYAHYSGTSMATPHVAAVAALVWSHDPSWSNQQIRAALAGSALDLGAPGRDSAYGFGLVRAKAALDHLSRPRKARR